MKVLFAVNNDNISNTIVKKYQKDYREIISYKNVYYFNAILKELQNDKTYDRIVISEDLEPFANNNYDTIDKFIFEKLDKISDEATKANGEDIQIILICSDRRSKSDDMLNRFFGIGIYNALIGDERSIDTLCKLMNQPRNKKEAKMAYKIEGSSVGYQAEDENSVSEAEVQNILAHYKRLGRDEDKYVDSFNNIVSQYTDAQLRIIIRYLPLNVKAVLEEKSPKYQELSTFSRVSNNSKPIKYIPKTAKNLREQEKINVKMLNNEKDSISKPIVIPSALNNKKFTKIETSQENKQDNIDAVEQVTKQEENIQDVEKRRRGRPRKNIEDETQNENTEKRGRGRPKKNTDLFKDEEQNKTENEEFDFDLFNIESDNTIDEDIDKENKSDDEVDIFSMVDDTSSNDENKEEEHKDTYSLNTESIEQKEEENEKQEIDLFSLGEITDKQENDDKSTAEERSMEQTIRTQPNLSTFMTSKNKIISFVGTTKNGTSFVVNNLALMLSSMNVSTAILDMTKSKNTYYIYTNDDNRLRNIAEKCIYNLEEGVAKGIEINKNLTIYTEIPGQEQEHTNIDMILSTLIQKHDLVLIDTDFNTNLEVFEKSQEIYLIQSMDVLTIQPLTAFLRNLKSKDILKQEKIKIIINKWQKVGGLSDKVLIGGMSTYNDPAMTFMTELFDKNNIKYCKIPFEVQNNIKYLESLVNCQVSLKGYTRQLLEALNDLVSMVYPMLNAPKYTPLSKKSRNRMQFSDETNKTLNKMRKNY